MRTVPAAAARLRVSASADSSGVPDFLSSNWSFSAEEAVQCQLESLKYNDHPHQDYGVEVMYRDLIPLKGQLILDDSLIWDRTDLNREFGFKDPVLKKKRYFSLQWFRVGGSWDGYWLTESLINDGDAFSGGIAY
ncbi:hypothetical protein PR202_ga27856 [Eleusine coracana subsp. coracana]|uniref:Uncharacterized protein n=1 Tax=Eleusine coracana subsp. coracana TaxID=191504 RepID=A0AAV5DI12_ELECO|nr:hypothetical protein PR202_ga27856 [Eleusine coracana subsp. coracana]